VEDPVFAATLVRLSQEPVRVLEGAGVVEVPVRLEEPVPDLVSARFEVRGVEAQEDCHIPDFQGAEGTLTFERGSAEATIAIWIGQDNLAETDERLQIVLSDLYGAALNGPATTTVLIEDDDRDALLDAANYGVVPNTETDQTEALQAALDAAASAGRGVLVLGPGNYEVSNVAMAPGTTLSAHGAHWFRPPDSELGTRVLSVVHDAPEDSLPTLIEGLSLDGRRDSQGSYRDYERENDHLIAVESRVDEPSRLNVSVESVAVSSGTGDGVAVGPDTVAHLCRIQAQDIWRDALSLHGGNSTLRVRGFDANATSGTSGIWLDGGTPGYEGIRTIDVEIEDARLSTGDVEMEVMDGSRVVLRRLSMTEPPFRVLAPNSRVEVIDSVIQVGVPTSRHNHLAFPGDVRFTRSTIVTSERLDEEAESEEVAREFATLSLRWATEAIPEPPESDYQLTLDACTFILGEDIDASDSVYAIDNPGPLGRVVVQGGSVLGDGFVAWFTDGCVGCELE